MKKILLLLSICLPSAHVMSMKKGFSFHEATPPTQVELGLLSNDIFDRDYKNFSERLQHLNILTEPMVTSQKEEWTHFNPLNKKIHFTPIKMNLFSITVGGNQYLAIKNSYISKLAETLQCKTLSSFDCYKELARILNFNKHFITELDFACSNPMGCILVVNDESQEATENSFIVNSKLSIMFSYLVNEHHTQKLLFETKVRFTKKSTPSLTDYVCTNLPEQLLSLGLHDQKDEVYAPDKKQTDTCNLLQDYIFYKNYIMEQLKNDPELTHYFLHLRTQLYDQKVAPIRLFIKKNDPSTFYKDLNFAVFLVMHGDDFYLAPVNFKEIPEPPRINKIKSEDIALHNNLREKKTSISTSYFNWKSGAGLGTCLLLASVLYWWSTRAHLSKLA